MNGLLYRRTILRYLTTVGSFLIFYPRAKTLITLLREGPALHLFLVSIACRSNETTSEFAMPTSEEVLDIQYRPMYISYLSLSLIAVARVHSKSQPCSSNQCNTARLESKLTRHFKNDVHLISWEWALVFKQGSTPRVPTTTSSYEATTPRYKECSRFTSGTLLYPHSSSLLSTLLTIVKINHFSATHLFLCTYCKFRTKLREPTDFRVCPQAYAIGK